MNQALAPLRLGFAGTPEFAVPALDALCKAQRIHAVFTQPDRPAGRGQAVHASPVKSRALELGLAIHQPQDFKSPGTLELLRALDLDVLVVVAYGLILPAAALRCPRLGCINIHASLLPRWRGAAPIQRALLAGDEKTGITIMRMAEGLDTGPMLARRELAIGARDTSKTLHDRLARLGAELIVETIDGMRRGDASAGAAAGAGETPQSAAGVTYAAKITKQEAMIDWRQDAPQIGRQIRAFNPWPIAETRLGGTQLRIWDAEAGPSPDPVAAEPGTVIAATREGIDVACGGGVLRILRLQLAGRKPLSAPEFLAGQNLEGARFAPA